MEDNLKELCTEQRNPRSENIDQMSTFDILKTINEEDKGIAFAIQNKNVGGEKSYDRHIFIISVKYDVTDFSFIL